MHCIAACCWLWAAIPSTTSDSLCCWMVASGTPSRRGPSGVAISSQSAARQRGPKKTQVGPATDCGWQLGPATCEGRCAQAAGLVPSLPTCVARPAEALSCQADHPAGKGGHHAGQHAAAGAGRASTEGGKMGAGTPAAAHGLGGLEKTKDTRTGGMHPWHCSPALPRPSPRSPPGRLWPAAACRRAAQGPRLLAQSAAQLLDKLGDLRGLLHAALVLVLRGQRGRQPYVRAAQQGVAPGRTRVAVEGLNHCWIQWAGVDARWVRRSRLMCWRRGTEAAGCRSAQHATASSSPRAKQTWQAATCLCSGGRGTTQAAAGDERGSRLKAAPHHRPLQAAVHKHGPSTDLPHLAPQRLGLRSPRMEARHRRRGREGGVVPQGKGTITACLLVAQHTAPDRANTPRQPIEQGKLVAGSPPGRYAPSPARCLPCTLTLLCEMKAGTNSTPLPSGVICRTCKPCRSATGGPDKLPQGLGQVPASRQHRWASACGRRTQRGPAEHPVRVEGQSTEWQAPPVMGPRAPHAFLPRRRHLTGITHTSSSPGLPRALKVPRSVLWAVPPVSPPSDPDGRCCSASCCPRCAGCRRLGCGCGCGTACRSTKCCGSARSSDSATRSGTQASCGGLPPASRRRAGRSCRLYCRGGGAASEPCPGPAADAVPLLPAPASAGRPACWTSPPAVPEAASLLLLMLLLPPSSALVLGCSLRRRPPRAAARSRTSLVN